MEDLRRSYLRIRSIEVAFLDLVMKGLRRSWLRRALERLTDGGLTKVLFTKQGLYKLLL